MITTIKAILINPTTKTVTPVRIGTDKKDLRAQLNCRKVGYGSFENDDTTCVDWHMAHRDDRSKYFEFKDDWNYLGFHVGNVLIVGRDKDGNLCDAKSSLEEITRKVRFLREADFMAN